jgi:opacity protein-like surface antigen
MKRFIFSASLFFIIFLFSSVSLAEVLFKDQALPKAYNWTGFYGGLNTGVFKPTMNITDNQATTFNATLQHTSNPRVTGGFQVGYRRQLDPLKTSGLYGVEFSANFSNATVQKEYGSSFALYDLHATSEVNAICLLQLIGGIAADKALLFLAGGLSWSSIRGSVTSLNAAPFFNSFSLDNKIFGTAIGGGIEYAFNEKFSARLKVDVITPNVYSVYDNVGDKFQIANNIVQGVLGLNYKFA